MTNEECIEAFNEKKPVKHYCGTAIVRHECIDAIVICRDGKVLAEMIENKETRNCVHRVEAGKLQTAL